MKTRYLLTMTALFLCVGSSTLAELQQREWMVEGLARTALVWTPESTNHTAAPLVFAFHGHGGGMQNAARTFKIHELWPEAVVVYMQGLPTVGQLTDPEGKKNGWNSNPDDSENRDLAFFDAVYASLRAAIDTNRVYSTGHSNGGGFTYCLWAARGETFAAVAPSAALSVKGLPRLKPKPALHVAGENDTLVKYEWQVRMMTAVRKLNGCADSATPLATTGDLVGTLYPSGTGTPFVSLISPGTHTFPKEAPALIVRFFKEHPRKTSL